jgi:protein-disulfide isomerase
MGVSIKQLPAFRTILDVISTAAIVVAAVVIMRSGGRVPDAANQSVAVPKTPVAFNEARRDGQRTARIALVEFSDFECQFCAAFVSDTLPKLRERYISTGQIQLAFMHLPLAIHDHAAIAAKAAECASQQRQFWPMHDALFEHRTELTRQDLDKRATAIGLDMQVFRSCMNGPEPADIAADKELARTIGVRGTPAFLIGELVGDHAIKASAVLSGALPYEKFVEAIDAATK